MLSDKDVLSFPVEQKGKIGVVLLTLMNRNITSKKCNQCVKLSKLTKLTGVIYNDLNGNTVECQFPKCMHCGEPSKEKWIPHPRQRLKNTSVRIVTQAIEFAPVLTLCPHELVVVLTLCPHELVAVLTLCSHELEVYCSYLV